MNGNPPSDPLDNPEYLRSESSQLRSVIETLTNPEVKRELASHAFYLAQRAEAISRIAEDPAIKRMDFDRHRPVLLSEAAQVLLSEAQQNLSARGALRELAAWYRSFAERAGDPTIWEARLRAAETLEAEVERMERRNPWVYPD